MINPMIEILMMWFITIVIIALWDHTEKMRKLERRQDTLKTEVLELMKEYARQGPVGPAGMMGATGLPGKPGISDKEKRKAKGWIGIISLRAQNMITNEEHHRLIEMYNSNDEENWTVAEELMRQLNKKARGEDVVVTDDKTD